MQMPSFLISGFSDILLILFSHSFFVINNYQSRPNILSIYKKFLLSLKLQIKKINK